MANPPTILVVDDEPDMLKYMSLLLEGQQYQVEVADSGIGAHSYKRRIDAQPHSARREHAWIGWRYRDTRANPPVLYSIESCYVFLYLRYEESRARDADSGRWII